MVPKLLRSRTRKLTLSMLCCAAYSPLAFATHFVRTLAPKWALPFLPVARLTSGENLPNPAGNKFIPIPSTVLGLANFHNGEACQYFNGKTGRRRQ